MITHLFSVKTSNNRRFRVCRATRTQLVSCAWINQARKGEIISSQAVTQARPPTALQLVNRLMHPGMHARFTLLLSTFRTKPPPLTPAADHSDAGAHTHRHRNKHRQSVRRGNRPAFGEGITFTICTDTHIIAQCQSL